MRLLNTLRELTGETYFIILFSDYSGRLMLGESRRDEYIFSFKDKAQLNKKLSKRIKKTINE